MHVLTHASRIYTGNGVAAREGRRISEADLDEVEDGALVVDDAGQSLRKPPGKILWLGPTSELPKRYLKARMKSLNGRHAIMPGLVDCHTHLIFGGDRSDEFAERCAGATYEQIAAKGGGIVKTVGATRELSEVQLLKLARVRVQESWAWGVRALEIKSGYGLSHESEIKVLQVAQKLRKEFPGMRFHVTYLGAHAWPKGRKQEEYLREMNERTLPEVARKKLADGCDVFIDQGYFSIAQGRTLLERARALGLKLRVHADELVHTGSAELACELGALSADHLLKVSESGIRKLAAASTVAVLLPGTAHYLNAAQAPARALLNAGARVALSTDFNPGTCPTLSLPTIMNLAALKLGMSRAEIFSAVTYNAAAALGLESQIGALRVGSRAAYSILPFARFEDLYYRLSWVPGVSA